MPLPGTPEPLPVREQRVIAALQCDGRVTAERAAAVLGLGPRDVHRSLKKLLGDGSVQVLGSRPRDDAAGAMMLRVRVLRGRIEAITSALAARDDIPLIDVSASGDEISAVLLPGAGPGNRLVLEQLPATGAVTSVSAQTVLHVFSDATDWRLDVLTDDERTALTPESGPAAYPSPLDGPDEAIVTALEGDGRLTAAAVAARTGLAESTVRRRLAALLSGRRLLTQVVVDPRRLGMGIDANVWMEVPPDHLDAAGRALARHPAVHGALATSGTANLCVAVWLRDARALYRFLTEELTGRSITRTETILVGRAVKRPGRG
ncbi:Lrp/AsnC family transcriptional regulator [Streptomyces liangshanensis]|uniref:Lrp/AsnC family transcriptional regulator n=1 Tax=Streptomyces liangshanensis TaxID=2717324 RepID=A0A6G9GT44_9ACTN|nr:Lrp/AsnC family transcriptional regulator [Streptomyces liangshanensis]QIQ01191.1 Lrp/AsnC family transcriptional regulator [Streptomyces liangshanensis]